METIAPIHCRALIRAGAAPLLRGLSVLCPPEEPETHAFPGRIYVHLKQALAIAPDNPRLKRYKRDYAGRE